MSRANARFQAERIRLVLAKTSIAQLLDGVQDCLDRLEQLLRVVDEVSNLSKEVNTAEEAEANTLSMHDTSIEFWQSHCNTIVRIHIMPTFGCGSR